jgi:hypothetical protein
MRKMNLFLHISVVGVTIQEEHIVEWKPKIFKRGEESLMKGQTKSWSMKEHEEVLGKQK